MADAEEGFSGDAVGQFLLDNGGRATNVQVVGHFSKYLNNPEFKVLNRQKFKDYINEVATVKTEKNVKYLVLKDEYLYREWIEPKHVIIRSAASQQPAKPSWPPPNPDPPKETDPVPVPPARRRRKSKDTNGSSPRPTISNPIPIPIYTGPAEQQSVVRTTRGEKVVEDFSQVEGVRDAREKFELESRLQTPSPVKPPSSTHAPTTAPTQAEPIPPPPVEIQVTEEPMAADSNGTTEEAGGDPEMETTPPNRPSAPAPAPPTEAAPAHISPTLVANAAAAEAQSTEASPSVQMARKLFENEANKQTAALTSPKLRASSTPKIVIKKALSNGSPRHHHHHHDDEEHGVVGSELAESVSLRSVRSTGSGNSFPESLKLEPLERQWMMESAKGNVPVLLGLAEQEPQLVTKRDFITGFSALHWGAKHGKKEMIRLVAERGIDVNMRSQGGYTPLHVAAMHNKEAIMQFLISEYNADINKRDYSGRKPHHYLQTCASSYIQQMLKGQSTAELLQPHNLMSLAEPKQEEKHRSKLGSLLRTSFRHSFRLWSSTENLEDGGHKRERTPPVTPPPSPKNERKHTQNVNYSHSMLMPPPSGYQAPSRTRKLRSTSDKNRLEQQHMRKSESDPDLLSNSAHVSMV